MANPYITEFAFKVSAAAIQRDGDDAAKLLATAENVVMFREQGVLTDAQVSALSDLLDIEIDVPDAPDTWDARVEALEADATATSDGLAEVAALAADTAEATEANAQAIVELAEIIGGGE